LQVILSPESESFLAAMPELEGRDLRTLIFETLTLDPRPGYERAKPSAVGAHWGMVVLDHEVKWSVVDDACHVFFIARAETRMTSMRSSLEERYSNDKW
jgi:hypothetical protein